MPSLLLTNAADMRAPHTCPALALLPQKACLPCRKKHKRRDEEGSALDKAAEALGEDLPPGLLGGNLEFGLSQDEVPNARRCEHVCWAARARPPTSCDGGSSVDLPGRGFSGMGMDAAGSAGALPATAAESRRLAALSSLPRQQAPCAAQPNVCWLQGAAKDVPHARQAHRAEGRPSCIKAPRADPAGRAVTSCPPACYGGRVGHWGGHRLCQLRLCWRHCAPVGWQLQLERPGARPQQSPCCRDQMAERNFQSLLGLAGGDRCSLSPCPALLRPLRLQRNL